MAAATHYSDDFRDAIPKEILVERPRADVSPSLYVLPHWMTY
ncbi:MAG: hypothetical protein U1D30_00545 [Planctomycetota bacterium]